MVIFGRMIAPGMGGCRRGSVRGAASPLSQGFTLHPTEKDPSVGTPGLGYSRFLLTGGKTGAEGPREPGCIDT